MTIRRGDEGNILDRGALEERLMGDSELAQEIIEAFLGDTQVQLDLLKAAIADGNAREARFHAHTIKGAAANVSAVGMQQVALETEQAAQKGGVEEAALFVPEIEEALAKLQEIVTHHRV